MNFLKKAGKTIWSFVCAVLSIIMIDFLALFNIRKIGESVFTGFFYPLIITVIGMLPFHQKINYYFDYIIGKGQLPQDILYVFAVCAGVLFFTLLINSAIQFLACLFKRNKEFVAIIKMQKSVSTYVMTVLSLIALWIAGMVPNFDVSSGFNLTLFGFGTLYLISSLFCDIYNYFVMSEGEIEAIYEKLIKERDGNNPNE